MADSFIQVNPDSTGKLLDTDQQVIPATGNTVQRERVVSVRGDDASATLRPQVENPPLLGAVRLAVAQLGEIRKTLRQRSADAGDVRRFSAKRYGSQLLRMTGIESLAVAQTELEHAELTRAGRRYLYGPSGTSDSLATRQSILASSCDLLLWNSAPRGGPTLFLDLVNFMLLSGTPGVAASLLGTVTANPVATAVTSTNRSTVTVLNTSGSNQSNYGTIIVSAGMALPLSAAAPSYSWFPLAQIDNLSQTASIAQGPSQWAEVKGRLAAPPGHGIAFHIYGAAGTSPLFAVSFIWVELQLDME